MTKDSSPNCGAHIIRDIADHAPKEIDPRLLPSTDRRKHEEREHNAAFETVPLSTISTSKYTTDSASSVSQTKVTSKNYQQAYLQEVAAQKEAAAKRSQSQNRQAGAQQASDALSLQEKKNEDILRARAHELMDQIYHWERERGQGRFDESIIEGTLSDLRQQYAAIPQHLQT